MAAKTVVCAACATDFVGKNSRAKYCSDTCRKRGLRGGTAPAKAKPSGLVAVTRRDLEQADRLETVLGQQAMGLAEKLSSGRDTGSAMAALSKEFRAVLDAALDGAVVVSDGLDELAERRDRKRAG